MRWHGAARRRGSAPPSGGGQGERLAACAPDRFRFCAHHFPGTGLSAAIAKLRKVIKKKDAQILDLETQEDPTLTDTTDFVRCDASVCFAQAAELPSHPWSVLC